jgi:hypothetical protein
VARYARDKESLAPRTQLRRKPGVFDGEGEMLSESIAR